MKAESKMLFGWFVALMLASPSVSCKRHTTITYIVPNGFRGIIKIHAERHDGATSRTASGDFMLRIPDSGELAILEPLPTTEWHQKIIRTRDGTPIVEWHNGERIPDTAIVFRPVTRISSTEEWFVVGTLDDVGAALKKAHGFTIDR